jgi:hypothetical protein
MSGTSDASGFPVGKPVLPAVDLMRTGESPWIVHSFAASRPPRSPQLTPTPNVLVFNVTVTGYEAVHSIHSPYYFYY